MAIWQVALHYIKNGNHIDYSASAFISSSKNLEEFFPETKSWCKTIRQYGELDSTCIEIDIDNGDEISIRIDLRNISKNQLQVLLNFAIHNDLFIKYNDALYDPCMDTFITIFRESEANKFIKNPENFLKELST